ncbi:MAG: hypothetical protein MJ056_07375 [Akkermansia sp.]|nr:hypothetical protein [Akkermansia sp.]
MKMDTGKFLTLLAAALCLSDCNTLKSDCQAISEREAQIAKEQPGDYYIGRRYYIPYTRLWGYLRRPGESWRTAKLVMMDEHAVHQPDRGPEPPLKNAVFGTDDNVEYAITGSFTGMKAYEPSSNLVLPLFKATSYKVINRNPGFLFKPSEKRSDDFVTLDPRIMPQPGACQQALAQ